MYIKTNQNNDILQYPYSLTDLRLSHPGTSFPEIITDELAGEFGVVFVNETSIPSYNSETEKLVEKDPIFQNGQWSRVWEVVQLTQEEIDANNESRRGSMIVSRFQAKTAVYNAGLLDDIESLINNANTDPVIKFAWNDAQEFRRNSPSIALIAQQLNLTDEQLDQLFIDAANITA